MAAMLAVVGLAPLAAAAWKLIDINREALTTSQQEYQLLLARSVSREIDIHLDGIIAQQHQLAQALGAAFGRRSRIDGSRIRRVLEEGTDERMRYVRFTDLRERSTEVGDFGVPPEARELFETALRYGAELVEQSPGRAPQPRLNTPFETSTEPRRTVLVAISPVVSHDKFRGVITTVIDFEDIWNQVAARRSAHTLFALDTNGIPFASTNLQQVRPGESPLEGSPLVQAFLGQSRDARTIPFDLQNAGGTESFIGSFTTTERGWGIFVQARQEQIYHPVANMIESTLTWSLAAVALALVAALFFAKTLSNPINRLAAASRAFAAGDFTSRAIVHSNNEIGELAENFNTMASRLESYIRKLRRAAEENNELFLGTIRALAQAIDAKDPYTRGHSVRVNKYSVLLARRLGLSESEIQEIHVSSLLHDVGKIGIDDSILKKPGVLTPEEFAVMKTHPVLGANIMAPIKKMKRILPGLRYHHERCNGSGYPDGLKGEEIPLMARIIAVADTFDAMTTKRPYQEAMTFEAAVARINSLKSIALDDRVVEAFNRAYSDGEIVPEEDDAASSSDRIAAI